MKIIVAMDSFKGSLTAEQACQIVADSIKSAVPETEVIVKPMADGGEGTAKAIMIAGGRGRWIKKAVTGPLPDMKVEAGFVWFEDERTALVEMATASGLELIGGDKRNPMKTTTYGTGELIAAAAKYQAKKILLAIGGRATVAGGTGAATALGWKFLDENGKELTGCGGNLSQIRKVISPAHPRQVGAEMQVLCDVDNPLCGENSAAKVYGPQKGATPEMVKRLDAGLAHLAKIIKEQIGCDVKDVPGAGAAGGMAAGAIAFMNGRLVSGIETVMSQSRLKESLRDADWVITGEGRFDSQSLQGKVISGIVRMGKSSGVKVAVLAGQVLFGAAEYQKFGVADAIGCMGEKMTLEYAIKHSEELLADAAKKFALKNLAG
jgi:glycerate kinase